MVTRDEQDGDPGVGDAQERLERTQDQRGGHAAAIEEVAAVDDHVGLSAQRGFERAREAGEEEVEPAAAALDPRTRWQVEAEVCVGDEQHPQVRLTGRRRSHSHSSTESRSCFDSRASGPRRNSTSAAAAASRRSSVVRTRRRSKVATSNASRRRPLRPRPGGVGGGPAPRSTRGASTPLQSRAGASPPRVPASERASRAGAASVRRTACAARRTGSSRASSRAAS